MSSNASTSEPTQSSQQAADAAMQREQLRAAMQQMLNAGKGEAAIDTLLEVIESLQVDNARWAARAAAAERARFGRRTEKLTAEELGQLALALGATDAEATQEQPLVPVPPAEEEQADPEESSKAKGAGGKRHKKRRHNGRTQLAPHLPRNVTYVPVPENERVCVHCGKPMTTIGHVDHECIEFVPARIEVNVKRCEKVACKEQDCKQDITVAPYRAEDFALRCLTDGRFELDTGRVERQIKEPVIGRKNYLFSGSAPAAQLLAGAYTLVCSCRNLGINTREYLVDVITKLQAGFPLRDINQLRPDNWAARRVGLVAHQQMAK